MTDPIVSYAADHSVTYYAPDDVYVFKLSEDVPWAEKLRVVIPPRP